MSDNTFSRVKKNQMKYVEKDDKVVKPLNNIDDVLKDKVEIPEKSISDIVKKETVFDETFNELINIRDLIEEAKNKQLDNIKKLNTKYDILTKMEREEVGLENNGVLEETKIYEVKSSEDKQKDLKSILERYGIRKEQIYKEESLEKESYLDNSKEDSEEINFDSDEDTRIHTDLVVPEISMLDAETKVPTKNLEMTFETMYRDYLDKKGDAKSEFAIAHEEEEKQEDKILNNEELVVPAASEEKKHPELVEIEMYRLEKEKLEKEKLEKERLEKEELQKIAEEQLRAAKAEVESQKNSTSNIGVDKLYETKVMKAAELTEEEKVKPVILENPVPPKKDTTLFEKMEETVEMKLMEEIAKKEIEEKSLVVKPEAEEEKVSVFWLVLLLVFVVVLFIIILQYRNVIWDGVSTLF